MVVKKVQPKVVIIPQDGRYTEVYYSLEGRPDIRVLRDKCQSNNITILMKPIMGDRKARKRIEEEIKSIPSIKKYTLTLLPMEQQEFTRTSGDISFYR